MERRGDSGLRPSLSRLRRTSAGAWLGLYLLLCVFPLILLLAGPIPDGGGRWWDFSMALGFSGLAMMGLQFALTARFRRATAPFGIDIIYYFHRWAALGAFALVLGHYAILKTNYRESLGPLNPADADWPLTAGRLALAIFAVLIVSSVWRKQLRIEYDRWRFWHGILAAAGVMLAILHIQGVGYYTRAPWKEAAWTCYSVMWLGLLFHIRVIKPWRLSRHPYRVVSVEEERGDAWTVTVEPAGGEELRFHPGQFAWLTLGASPFRAREHPFSFSGSASEPQRLQFTIKELGDFTRTIRFVKAGEAAFVDGPHGSFTTDLYPNAPGFVLIAGGVGIAPIMSILRTLAARRDARPLILIYGNAHWDRVIFREALEELKKNLNLKVTHILQRPPPEWTGETGLITREVLGRHLPDGARDWRFFLCGPVPMTRSVVGVLRGMGIPLRQIHSEHFDMA